MFISYDLVNCGDSLKEFNIEFSYLLKANDEQGQIREVSGNIATAVGDLNKYISCGVNKSIIWEYQKDILNKNNYSIELYPYIKPEAVSFSNSKVNQPFMTSTEKDIPYENNDIENFRGRYLPSQKNVYVLVIAMNKLENKDLSAKKEAALFLKYAAENLCIEKENINLLENPDSATFVKNIKRFSALAKAMQGKGDFMLYFLGDNVVAQSKMYLSLADGAYALQEIYAQLTEYPLNHLTIILETDFTAAKAEMLIPNKNKVKENVTVFCAASPGEQNIRVSEQEYHLFTYFLLKSIRDTYGDVSYKEVFTKTKESVSKNAIHRAEKSQTPAIYTSTKTGLNWKSWKFLN